MTDGLTTTLTGAGMVTKVSFGGAVVVPPIDPDEVTAIAVAAIAEDDTVMAAAASAAVTAVDGALGEAGVARSTPAEPTAQELILRGANGGRTWMQAGAIDSDAGVALPTDETMGALARRGVPLADGLGELVIRGAGEAATWLQASGEIDALTGVAGPTAVALAALGRVGVVLVVRGAPPDGLSLPVGAARIYTDGPDGGPVLAIGVS